MSARPANSWFEAALHALGGYPESQRKRAGSALGLVFAERRNARGSRLTGDGHPLELAFATRSSEARWTADPWDPDAARSPGDSALAACTRLGLAEETLRAFLAAGFGADFAWVGGRHGAGDRFKFYLSCPQKHPLARIGEIAGSRCPAPRCNASLRMVAFDPAGGEIETYWRASPVPLEMPALLAPARHAPEGTGTVRAVERLWGHRIRDRLPGGKVGVSFRTRSGGGTVAATLYLFARAVWGADRSNRRQWLGLPDLDPGQRRAYEFATRGLATRRSPLTHHGSIGLHFGAGRIDLGLGVRPVSAATASCGADRSAPQTRSLVSSLGPQS